jgi:hypothetical protein
MLCTATGYRHGHAQPGLPAVDRPLDWGHQRHGEANVGERRQSAWCVSSPILVTCERRFWPEAIEEQPSPVLVRAVRTTLAHTAAITTVRLAMRERSMRWVRPSGCWSPRRPHPVPPARTNSSIGVTAALLRRAEILRLAVKIAGLKAEVAQLNAMLERKP